MALPPLAPVSALEIRLRVAPGTLAGTDLAWAEQCLADASGLVRAEAGLDWVDVDGVTITAPAVVVTVVTVAAHRAYRNPDEYQSESVTGYAYQAAPDSVGVYLTGAEVRTVKRAAAGAKGLSYTVRTPSAYGDPSALPLDLLYWGLEP